MNTQNILGYYGQKLEIKTDFSELFDFILDTTDNIDIKLDFSELYDYQIDTSDFIEIKLDTSEYIDFELDNSDVTPIIYINPTINELISYCDYTIQTQTEFSILTENGECILYQH